MFRATVKGEDITISNDSFQVAQAMDSVALVTAFYAEKERAKADNRDMNPAAYESFLLRDPWGFTSVNDPVVALSSRASAGRKIEHIRLTTMCNLLQIVNSIARDK